MTCALALAQQGRRVRVLEAREDPRTERGRRVLTIDAKETELANAALARRDGPAAAEHFGAAGRARAAVWGSRNRNLLFDRHSLGYLHSLGARVGELPSLRTLDTHLGAGQPTVRIRYGPRQPIVGGSRLDAATIMAQRDPVAVPTIAQVENVLRDAVEADPLIDVLYAAPAVGCSETPTSVSVSYGEPESTMTADFLVVADGAGRRSLSRQLGIERVELGAESVDIAAFKCDPDDEALDHPLREGWLEARTTDRGWVVFLSSGTGLLTVNLRKVVAGHSASALDLARAAGVYAPLAEQPADVRYALDRAAHFTVGTRTVIVGDAACRASPVWAFGAQFALLWAQMVADLCANAVDTYCNLPADALSAFSAEADRIANTRLEFERSALDLVDFANPEIRAGSGATTATGMLSAIDDIELAFNSRGPHGGTLQMRLGIALDDLIGANDSLDLAAFYRSVGRVQFEGLLDLRFERGRGESTPAETGPTRYRTALETVRISDGSMSMERSDAGYWRIAMDHVVLNRTLSSSTCDSLSTIERAELLLPDEFVTQSLQQLAPQLWLLGVTRKQQLSFEVELQPGVLEIGTFKLSLRGTTLVRMTLKREPGKARITFHLARGMAMAENFSAFVRRTPLGATRAVRVWQTLFGGLADPFVDIWAAGASQFVRQVDFDINSDGTGSVTYHASGIPLRFPLSGDDVRLLVEKLFNSESCERIMHQYQERVASARLTQTPTRRETQH